MKIILNLTSNFRWIKGVWVNITLMIINLLFRFWIHKIYIIYFIRYIEVKLIYLYNLLLKQILFTGIIICITWWFKYFKTAHKILINKHHRCGIIIFTAIIRSREYCYKRSICKELITIFNNLRLIWIYLMRSTY